MAEECYLPRKHPQYRPVAAAYRAIASLLRVLLLEVVAPKLLQWSALERVLRRPIAERDPISPLDLSCDFALDITRLRCPMILQEGMDLRRFCISRRLRRLLKDALEFLVLKA